MRANFNGPDSKANNYIVSSNCLSDHWKKDLDKSAKIIHNQHRSFQLGKQQKKQGTAMQPRKIELT
jgi:hypothetical protein